MEEKRKMPLTQRIGHFRVSGGNPETCWQLGTKETIEKKKVFLLDL